MVELQLEGFKKDGVSQRLGKRTLLKSTLPLPLLEIRASLISEYQRLSQVFNYNREFMIHGVSRYNLVQSKQTTRAGCRRDSTRPRGGGCVLRDCTQHKQDIQR